MKHKSSRPTSAQRGYNYKWQKESKRFLDENPLCKYCYEVREIKAATVVDHIIPHKGNMKLFWDRSNWQSLCDHCHNSIKAKEEARGVRIGGDESGQPFDLNSHWYK